MTLEEALAASVVEPVNDIFEINPETRVITVPASEKLFGVSHDGNTERKHFRCSKIVGDNIDLSTMHLYINYQNANGDKYPYLVEDIRTDGDYITFSWLIGPDVVAYKGQIKFIVCAKKGDGTIPEWNTTLAEGTVLEGLEATDEVVERNPDIITQLLNRMHEVEKIATKEEMQGYVNTYLTEHPGEIDETLTDPKKAAPADVVGSLKEDLSEQINVISDERNFIPIKLSFSDNVGKYITRNGKIATNDTFSTSDLIPIEPRNKKIRITCKQANPYISRVAFLKKNVLSDDNIIDYFVNADSGTFDIEIPKDAKYVVAVSDTATNGTTVNGYPKARFFPSSANVDELRDKIAGIERSNRKPALNIGSKVYAVVGDTLQIFKKSIVDSLGIPYIMKIESAKGRAYPRYWEYTPNADDVGSSEIKFSLLNVDGSVIDERIVSLITVNASNTSKNVLNIGDSTMAHGQIPIELSRRIKGTSGAATAPAALALSNINVVGRIKNGDKTVGWEGTGGWTYTNYTSQGSRAVRFQVANAQSITVKDLIRIGATNSYGYYQFEVTEVNVTNGTGNIRAVFSYTTPYSSNFLNEVSASGNLTNANNSVVGSYLSFTEEFYQPFWNSTVNQFDIKTYVNDYCGNKVDYIFILLGINSLYGTKPFTSVDSVLDSCKNLLRKIHADLPNTKILLSTNNLVSQNGGLGFNYNAQTYFGQYDVDVINHLIFAMNKAYYTLETDTEFMQYVEIINTHAQFDADNAFPITTKNVNTRSGETESVGTNGVHPTNNGYWQIADAEFRALLAN